MPGYETDDTNSECEESENKSNDGDDDLLDDAFHTGNDAEDENVRDDANFSDHVITQIVDERQEGSEQPRIQSTVDGSASEIIPHPTRKRNRQLGKTKAADSNQPVVDPPKRRGPNINRSATKTLENLPEGSKISLTMSTGTKVFVGPSASQFATECGIVMRNVKFNLLRTDRRFMEYVNEQLRIRWKRTRGNLSEHWKNNGGKMNPQFARSQMKPNCRSQEDWNHMCDYWELESTRRQNSPDSSRFSRTQATIQVSAESASEFGELVADPVTKELLHYTEKPETFIGPNVSISANVRVGACVTLMHCIILDDSEIQGEGDYKTKLGITILVYVSLSHAPHIGCDMAPLLILRKHMKSSCTSFLHDKDH
ncbi:hypothetical protein L1987_55143 [Smallanthus sonchifolius]|uniref:Uncharacterized protein n=1 Tax=Smallanthus sonchifolius TaxID=185202 RepID=A0ACB9E9G8_9ASTR|nr:hypothetical protein L1987_55143 [Smallanthus sonchifolius]